MPWWVILIAAICVAKELNVEEYAVEITGNVNKIDGFEIIHKFELSEKSVFLVRSLPADGFTSLDLLRSHPQVVWAEQQIKRKQYTRNAHPIHKRGHRQAKTTLGSNTTWDDPLFPDQWHLINTGQFGGIVGQDINVKEAWTMGYSGEGVRIAIVDDGFQHTHPDLASAYRNDSSRNFNSGDPFDPAPDVDYDYHGTSCAGVALARNNTVCGVGAAYFAEGAGIRLISEMVSDAEEAEALTYMYQKNHIYSNSWGPNDDGYTLGRPGTLTMKALADGVTNGRNGLGSIYVWAAGNGLQEMDNCNYDGYANARETIAVGAVDNNGVQSYYSEPCAAMLVCAPSSGINIGITTTDLLGGDGYSDDMCTNDFGGTSSACPLVAGVVALMLQANNKLTWRDVQFILLSTADKNDMNDTDWTENGAGYHVNHKYGFGRVNAYAAVTAAVSHKPLDSATVFNSQVIEVGQPIVDNSTLAEVNSTLRVTEQFTVEYVAVDINITHTAAGDLQIVLVSPQGTESVLAELHGLRIASELNVTNVPALANTTFQSVFASFGARSSVAGNISLPLSDSIFCDNVSCEGMKGNIALIDRGECIFPLKATNAQECGAIGLVVVNSIEGPPFEMSGTGDISIPVVMVSLADGRVIQHLVQNGSSVEIEISAKDIKIPVDGYSSWRFSTLRNWGEKSAGDWKIKVTDNFIQDEGYFNAWQINIYGSEPSTKPNHKWVIIGVVIGVAAVAVIAGVAAFYYRRKRREMMYSSIENQMTPTSF